VIDSGYILALIVSRVHQRYVRIQYFEASEFVASLFAFSWDDAINAIEQRIDQNQAQASAKRKIVDETLPYYHDLKRQRICEPSQDFAIPQTLLFSGEVGTQELFFNADDAQDASTQTQSNQL
jgi:hypothetical protein